MALREINWDSKSLGEYQNKFSQLVRRNIEVLRQEFGVGYNYSTIFSNYGNGFTPAISAGRFDKGVVFATSLTTNNFKKGLSEQLHMIFNIPNGKTSTFTFKLTDYIPELSRLGSEIEAIYVEDFKENKLAIKVTSKEGQIVKEYALLLEYQVQIDRRGFIYDFEINKSSFFKSNILSKENSERILLATDGTLFFLGSDDKGAYLRHVDLQKGNRKIYFPMPERLLGIEMTSLGLIQVQGFHGGTFKAMILNSDN